MASYNPSHTNGSKPIALIGLYMAL